MRTTQRLIVGMAVGPSIATVLVLAGFMAGCPHNPPPSPVGPDASDAASPAPIVEPGPVPAGDPEKCAAAARHADDVCPGSLDATKRSCVRAGGADPGLIPCIMAATGCRGTHGLQCDALSRASR